MTDTPPVRAALQVIRDDQKIWRNVAPTPSQQEALEAKTSETGESHRIGAVLFSNIYYKDPEAASLYKKQAYVSSTKTIVLIMPWLK